MGAEENVERVRRGFEAMAAGDIGTVLELWHPDVLYHGFDLAGERREFKGRDAFFGMAMELTTMMDEASMELDRAWPVGDEIVVCDVRAIRRPKGAAEAKTFNFVMVFRLEDGRITHGTDMVDSGAEAFWRGVAAGR